MTKRPNQPGGTFRCPHCGAAVKAGSPSCPACGSDKTTGWSEGADVWGADIPTGYSRNDDFDYDEFIEHEFGSRGSRILGLPVAVFFLIILGVVIAGLVLFALLG